MSPQNIDAESNTWLSVNQTRKRTCTHKYLGNEYGEGRSSSDKNPKDEEQDKKVGSLCTGHRLLALSRLVEGGSNGLCQRRRFKRTRVCCRHSQSDQPIYTITMIKGLLGGEGGLASTANDNGTTAVVMMARIKT